MDMLIREMREGERGGVREINERVWLETYPNDALGITVEDIKKFFEKKKREREINQRPRSPHEMRANCKTFVAEVGGIIIGYAHGCVRAEVNQLQSIYILSEYHGKGIGRKLFEKFLEEVFDKTKDTIVQVATYNEKAIAAYKKWGFVDTGKRFSDERFRFENGAIIPEMELLRKSRSRPYMF